MAYSTNKVVCLKKQNKQGCFYCLNTQLGSFVLTYKNHGFIKSVRFSCTKQVTTLPHCFFFGEHTALSIAFSVENCFGDITNSETEHYIQQNQIESTK
jgi:hypothetical protein